jgi:hypothetical protein
VYRLTFSKSLAEHIQRHAGHPLDLRRRRFLVGRPLNRGEPSPSGAYAIVDARKGKTLRIALDADIADILRSDSRTVQEAWLA